MNRHRSWRQIFAKFGDRFIAHCLVNTLESRIIPNLHDSHLFRGITDLRNKVELVRKALVTGNPILDSRAEVTVDIFHELTPK
jgi:hypothetical protein